MPGGKPSSVTVRAPAVRGVWNGRSAANGRAIDTVPARCDGGRPEQATPEGARPNGTARRNGKGTGAAVDEAATAQPDAHPPSLPSTVIHELRTPLTSIHGYAQVLQRSLRGEQRSANALAIIVRESTRLSAMLAALSELADLETEPAPTALACVEVADVVAAAAHEVARRDDGAHPIETVGRGTARCCPTILGQALLHLLTNAVRYSDAGEPVTITIAEDGVTSIEIADRGIGLLADEGERAYRPFERGALAREAGIRGLGLGLYLAREALRRTGGTLTHRARAGGGTVFCVTLPRD